MIDCRSIALLMLNHPTRRMYAGMLKVRNWKSSRSRRLRYLSVFLWIKRKDNQPRGIGKTMVMTHSKEMVIGRMPDGERGVDGDQDARDPDE